MRIAILVVALTALAGCGVDGEPIRPSMNTSIGVGSHGVHTSTSVGASVGNVSVGVGVGL